MHSRVAALEQLHRRGIEIDDTARCVKAFVGHSARRRLGQLGDCGVDRGLDFTLRYCRIDAGINAETKIDAAGGWYR